VSWAKARAARSERFEKLRLGVYLIEEEKAITGMCYGGFDHFVNHDSVHWTESSGDFWGFEDDIPPIGVLNILR
jgi:hypothetical protein